MELQLEEKKKTRPLPGECLVFNMQREREREREKRDTRRHERLKFFARKIRYLFFHPFDKHHFHDISPTTRETAERNLETMCVSSLKERKKEAERVLTCHVRNLDTNCVSIFI